MVPKNKLTLFAALLALVVGLAGCAEPEEAGPDTNMTADDDPIVVDDPIEPDPAVDGTEDPALNETEDTNMTADEGWNEEGMPEDGMQDPAQA